MSGPLEAFQAQWLAEGSTEVSPSLSGPLEAFQAQCLAQGYLSGVFVLGWD